jgi:hypothetical protein
MASAQELPGFDQHWTSDHFRIADHPDNLCKRSPLFEDPMRCGPCSALLIRVEDEVSRLDGRMAGMTAV